MPHQRRKTGLLSPLDPQQEREVMRRFRQAESGMDGERAGLPAEPDDAVAFKLLEAAEAAIGRGDRQKGVTILRLVVKDYWQSQDAAFARRVIDRFTKQPGDHGR